MSDREEKCGFWIEHDGAEPLMPNYCILDIRVQLPGKAPACGAELSCVHWPGFYWRWRQVRVGWFRKEWRRVCDDPKYAPITHYRIRKPRGLLQLQELIRDLPPEVPA